MIKLFYFTYLFNFLFFITAIYNYWHHGPHCLNLTVGDVVEIIGECDNWYYGRNKHKGSKGIFPKSFAHIPVQTINYDVLMHEITSVLREWGHHWKHLYVVSNNNQSINLYMYLFVY